MRQLPKTFRSTGRKYHIVCEFDDGREFVVTKWWSLCKGWQYEVMSIEVLEICLHHLRRSEVVRERRSVKSSEVIALNVATTGTG